MKSLEQLELEYCVKTKVLSYWARIVKPSCEDCRKNDYCELLPQLKGINEELTNLKQKWDAWEAPKFVIPNIFKFNDVTQHHKMIEETRKFTKQEKERAAIDVFKRKSEIEDKITSCKNKRVYAAMNLNAICFYSQDVWNIAKCNDCTFYDPRGICSALGIYNPKSPRICEFFVYVTDDDIKERKEFMGIEDIEV